MLKKSKQKELPVDNVYEILVNLPVKTLSRFKSVCKSWSSIISSPQFQKDHYDRWQRRPLIFTMRFPEGYTYQSNLPQYTLHFITYNSAKGSLVNSFSKTLRRPDPLIHFIPIQSCRGLVCIASDCGIVLICNPSTQEIISLPRISVNSSIGFGYSASTAEFRVVKFFYDGKKGRCLVCNLVTRVWREVRSPPCHARQCWAPFIHGAVHLMPLLGDAQDNHLIAVFDLDTEEYTSIPLPKNKNYDPRALMHLTELRGSLSLTFDFTSKERKLELWYFKDYSEWVKWHIIDLSKDNVPSPWWGCPWVYPVGILDGKTIFLNVSGSELWCYDLRERNITSKLDNELEMELGMYDLKSTLYVESFFALDR